MIKVHSVDDGLAVFFRGECNFGMHRLGGGCGRYILFAGVRHILFWGIYVVNGLGYLQLIFCWSGRTVLFIFAAPQLPNIVAKQCLLPEGVASGRSTWSIYC